LSELALLPARANVSTVARSRDGFRVVTGAG